MRSNLTERQMEKILRDNPPIGCLHERHPQLGFAAVLEYEGGHWATFMDRFVPLDKGTKVRLFKGNEVMTV